MCVDRKKALLALMAAGVFDPSGADILTFNATTTTASESVTIDRMTPATGSLTIDWGDGQQTTVNAGDTATKSTART